MWNQNLVDDKLIFIKFAKTKKLNKIKNMPLNIKTNKNGKQRDIQ